MMKTLLTCLAVGLLLSSCQNVACHGHGDELTVITLRQGDDTYSFNRYQTDIRKGYSFTYRSYKGSYTQATKQVNLGQLTPAQMQPIFDALCQVEKREHRPTPIEAGDSQAMPFRNQVSVMLDGQIVAYNGDDAKLQESYAAFWKLVKQYAASR